MREPPALLVLEDGTRWPGVSFGAAGEFFGEVVFNTSMTGYQEILTDPSYHGQIITFTAPHIGNTGVNLDDEESARVWAAGLIVRSASPGPSNWRARQSLAEYLALRGIPAMTEVETRALVRHVRTHGAMRAAMSTADPDPERLLHRARAGRDMNGLDLVREVTCAQPYEWIQDPALSQGWWSPARVGERRSANPSSYRVVAYDFGIKRNILHQLAARGCRVVVVPATTSAAEVLAQNPDGIFLSNGPGDPAAVTYAITAVRELLGQKPMFGICLGHQILALALGARTYKLKFGHRGGNQPVQLNASKQVRISAHNHGFAVDPATLPAGVHVSHLHLNDGCCEGIEISEYRAFAVQYHPESSPGPHDSADLFDRFIELMAKSRGQRT